MDMTAEYKAEYKRKVPPAAVIAVQRQEKTRRVNRTGMPDRLKSSIEGMSGYNLDPVRVHYNSPEPAKLQALAYTQGTDIHVAPGQEHHLPHEAWHVVQQMQGRVRPTMRIKGIGVNGSPALEHEADVMGRRAVQGVFLHSPVKARPVEGKCVQARLPALPGGAIWGNIYQGIAAATAFEGTRTIQDSQNLIGVLDTPAHDDDYYKLTLEGDGLRRLAYDIKQVKGRVKAARTGRNPFRLGEVGILRTAQGLINNKVREIENQEYGAGGVANYINRERNTHFNRVKARARRRLQRIQGKNNAYLGTYFNPTGGIIFTLGGSNAFYRKVKENFQKIENHLDDIGYKNNYSELPNTYAYVYPGRRRWRNAMIGGANVRGTHIKSRVQHGAETGLQIRLSSLYRRAPKRGRDSQFGVIIHEASHLILGTKDYAYGNDIYGLNSRRAIKNADTYEHAAEDA